MDICDIFLAVCWERRDKISLLIVRNHLYVLLRDKKISTMLENGDALRPVSMVSFIVLFPKVSHHHDMI
jgi:hypothetical protein